jgi:phage-related minor tail protein
MAGERTVKIKFTGDSKGLAQETAKGEQAVTKWGKTVDTVSSSAATAAAAGGAAIAAALGAGVLAGLEQSQVEAKLAAQLGATGPAAEAAGDAAGNLYARGIVGSIEEAASAVKTVLQNNLVPKDAGQAELDAVAARVSDLAVVLDEDASAVGRAVSQMIRTGIADSAEEAFDILNKGAQLGINKSEDLLDTFNEYGTQFRKLGVDGPAALGLINQAIKAGARDSDVAADALKEFSIRAIDGSKTTAEGFKALGLDAELMGKNIARGGDFANEALDVTLDKLRGIKDPVAQNAAAVALFGTQAEDLGAALFAMDPSTATKGLEGLGTAAEQTGKTLEQSAGAQVKAFGRELQGKLIVYLGATVGWLQKNSDTVKTLALVLGPLVGIIAAIVTITKVYTAVQAALNVVLSLNPIGLVVLAVAALVAGIILLYKNSETFRNIVTAVWAAVKVAVQFVVDYFKNFVIPFWKAVFDGIVTGVKFVIAVWRTQWNVAVSIFTWVVDRIKGFVNNLVAGFQFIVKIVTFVVNDVRSRFSSLVDFIKGLPGRIRSAASGMFDGIKNAFRSAINYVVDRWNNLSFSLPSVNIPGFGQVGGFTLSTPNIPRLASGGWMQPGQTYLTGERGPELLTASRRTYVNSAGATADMAGAPTVQVFIGERELTDIVDVRVEQNNRQLRRRAGARA